MPIILLANIINLLNIKSFKDDIEKANKWFLIGKNILLKELNRQIYEYENQKEGYPQNKINFQQFI